MTLNRRQLFRLVGARALSPSSEQRASCSLLSRKILSNRLPKNPCSCALTKNPLGMSEKG